MTFKVQNVISSKVNNSFVMKSSIICTKNEYIPLLKYLTSDSDSDSSIYLTLKLVDLMAKL